MKIKLYETAGRPRYEMIFPSQDEFTILDIFIANGVNPETGKGEKCSAQTIRAGVKHLLKVKLLERVADKLSAPNSTDGKGRKMFVFRRVIPHGEYEI